MGISPFIYAYFIYFLFFGNTNGSLSHSLLCAVFILPLYHTPQSNPVVMKSEEDISE